MKKKTRLYCADQWRIPWHDYHGVLMRKIIVLLSISIFLMALPIQSMAASLTLGAEVVVLKNVLQLSKEEAQKICEENPDRQNCHIVIANDEDDNFFEATPDIDKLALTGNQYPIRMLDFE